VRRRITVRTGRFLTAHGVNHRLAAAPSSPRRGKRGLPGRGPTLRPAWALQILPHVRVSGHVYDVKTGLVTTVVDAKASRPPA
jgi:hypothetical protein